MYLLYSILLVGIWWCRFHRKTGEYPQEEFMMIYSLPCWFLSGKQRSKNHSGRLIYLPNYYIYIKNNFTIVLLMKTSKQKNPTFTTSLKQRLKLVGTHSRNYSGVWCIIGKSSPAQSTHILVHMGYAALCTEPALASALGLGQACKH